MRRPLTTIVVDWGPFMYMGGNFCPNWKTVKNLKKEKKGKGGKEKKKKKKSDKTHVKIPLWSLNTAKKSTKTGKNFRGGGGRIFLAGQNIYPCSYLMSKKL